MTRLRGAALLVAVATATACDDGGGPTSVLRQEPATVEISPASLELTVGGTVQLFTVRRGADGRTLSPLPVTYRSTDSSVAVVSRTGLVRAVSPGSGSIVATVDGTSATAALRVVAPAAGSELQPVRPPALPVGRGDGSYSIRIAWAGTANARAQEVVGAAVERWRRVVVGDLPDVSMDIPADACFDGQVAESVVVDDLLVYVRVVAIDGPAGTLARAGPCFVRSGSSLPVVGVVELDEADLDRSPATVESVLVHELGHVLGIGTLWEQIGLLHGDDGDDPVFLGETALGAWTELGGSAMVPVENRGGKGTRLGHWRESVFRTELMTGWLGSGGNPMSRMTVASLRDLGYAVNMSAADPYVLPGESGASPRMEAGRGLEIVDELITPRFVVDRDGTVRRVD
ncbi:MAG TPA: leishmanolysin-related zinc metalloendopeptidase [Gemmatimonadales bacterium]